MFTGIITHTAKLHKNNGSILTFNTKPNFCEKLKKGTSVSINGACLTVIGMPRKTTFSVQLMAETFKKTMLGQLKLEDQVNLELPVSVKSLLSGHLVQGHIDDVGTIQKIQKRDCSYVLEISISENLAQYMVDKGSIAVNGISLTVIKAFKTRFVVGIIPYTLKHTMIQHVKVGDQVNIEVDVIAKYVRSLLKP